MHPAVSSEGEDEYFSDASEGRPRVSRPATPASPIPKTRIEKIDDRPSHGEVPGTPAYEQRVQDAVPDEVEIVPEGRLSKRASQILEPTLSPGGTIIPRTVVEKIDPASASHGDVPGTTAYEQRQADAAPDLVFNAAEPERRRSYTEETGRQRSPSDVPIPQTIVTRVDSIPAGGEIADAGAFARGNKDAREAGRGGLSGKTISR